MSFAEKHRFAGGRTEEALLKITWEGEIFGVGMFETLAEMFLDHAEMFTAIATVEWCNAHDAGISVSLEQAERLGREGAAFARQLRTFERMVQVMKVETPEAEVIYKLLGTGARTPELKALADDHQEHEVLIRDWMVSVLDGKPDNGERIFAYLQRHGISREQAVTPRKLREDLGGDKQQLVLAFFPSEAAADRAAQALKSWEKAIEYMKVDAIGVLVRDEKGKIKEHKLGKRAGKNGMGIGVVLGLIAAIPSGGLSFVGGALAGAIGGGIIGEFFHRGLKMTDDDVARVGREFDKGHAAVGVLTWDFETEAVAEKLKELGGTPRTHEVAKVTAEDN